jgi:hypothetical protein
VYIGGADIEEEPPAIGEGVTLEVVLLRLECIFSCWTAALRPRRVKGRLASPISCEWWELSGQFELNMAEQ